MGRLCFHALRRTLPAWSFALLLVLLLLAARGAGAPPLVPPDERALASLRALARQDVWSVLFVFAPVLFLQAARLGTARTNAWLAPTPAARASLALALAAGCALAGGAATLLTALAGEAATASTGAAWRCARQDESPVVWLLDDAPSVRWSVPAPAQGERLRLWTTVAIGSGPAVSARFSARSTASAASTAAATTVEARVAGRTALELTPPANMGEPLELELERVGPGAVLVLPPQALEILAPAASERLTALALGSRAWLLLAAGTALAFGLARLMRPALAAGLVLALALCSWSSPLAARVVPGADLPEAWRRLEGGLVPADAPLGAWAGALALSALGIALQACAPARREDPA